MLGPGITEALWTLSVSILKRPYKLLIDLTGLDPNPRAAREQLSSLGEVSYIYVYSL